MCLKVCVCVLESARTHPDARVVAAADDDVLGRVVDEAKDLGVPGAGVGLGCGRMGKDVRVCVRQSVRGREGGRGRGRGREREGVRGVCVCVCVHARERERGEG